MFFLPFLTHNRITLIVFIGVWVCLSVCTRVLHRCRYQSTADIRPSSVHFSLLCSIFSDVSERGRRVDSILLLVGPSFCFSEQRRQGSRYERQLCSIRPNVITTLRLKGGRGWRWWGGVSRREGCWMLCEHESSCRVRPKPQAIASNEAWVAGGVSSEVGPRPALLPLYSHELCQFLTIYPQSSVIPHNLPNINQSLRGSLSNLT